MNYRKYINMMLLQMSNKYQYNLIEMKTYRRGEKYSGLKLVIYKYDENDEDEKYYYKTLEFKNERELILKLKEMI